MNNHIKVAVIGATGKAGKYILNELLAQGYHVKALIRNPESYTLSHPSMEIVKGDIKDPETAIELIAGCDVVISAIGQLKDEPLISYLAIINIAKAMEQFNIKRYIFISGISIDVPGDQKSAANLQASEWMKNTFPIVVADKQKAFEWLERSNLDWTMIRLPWIEQTDEKRGMKVDLTDCLGEKISTSDLAVFIREQITDDRYIKKAPFVASL